MNYLCIDVGTTGIKCGVFSEQGEMLYYCYIEQGFKEIDGESYVNIDGITFIIENWLNSIGSRYEIASVSVSGIGESFVILDKNDKILFYPMLYTDTRGKTQAQKIENSVGASEYFKITGVMPHYMYSLSKILYIKENYPEIYEKADKIMLVGDYICYILTGKRFIDFSLAARTGAFDIKKQCFSDRILDKFGIDAALFSLPARAGTIVGDLKKEFGLNGAKLVLGAHDQVCACIGAGVISAGNASDGMGTVECITAIFDKIPTDCKMGYQGYPVVPFPIDGLFCTYLLNFSCGSTVNWFKDNIMHGFSDNEKDFFSYMENKQSGEPSKVIVLPYFGGACTPYSDANAKGMILNLTTATKDYEIYSALTEGLAFEMKFNTETVNEYGIRIKSLVASGGCSKSDKWMQKKADIQGVPVKILYSSEGGLIGLAMLSAVALKKCKNIEEAKEVFVRYKKEFLPDTQKSACYNSKYEKYKNLYKKLKEFM